MDKLEDENFLVSSDAESEFGDENHLFYDDDSDTKKEIKHCLRAFDRDNGGLSNVYQEKFVPKLNDRSQNFTKWLIETDWFSSTIPCPNAEHDPNCSEPMEFVFAVRLYDLYQLKCKNCSRQESIRKNSIFYGLKCNLRSVIRILYGWVKGIDLDIMANLLGLNRKIVGTIYNRAARVAFRCLGVCLGIGDFGGENIVVLIDLYPYFTQNGHTVRKDCRPILCVSEMETIPQKFWLEPLDFWEPSDQDEMEKMRKHVVDVILALVKPNSILVVPNYDSVPLYEELLKLASIYPTVKYRDELLTCSTDERPFPTILDTIWKKPLSLCEEAQFYNPDYISQFCIRHIWNEATDKESFMMLILFIVFETRRKNIERYL